MDKVCRPTVYPYLVPLVLQWSWGEISPQKLNHMMKLFKQDLENAATLDTTLLDILCGIGSSGSNLQHCHSQLVKGLQVDTMPKQCFFKVPLQHSVYGCFEKDMGVVWPHELFAKLFHHYKDAFWLYIVGSTGRLRTFWQSVREGNKFKNHPVRVRRNLETRAIPLILHGDGFPCSGIGKSWGKQMDSWQWSSLTNLAGSKLSCFLCFCVHQVLRIAPTPLQKVWPNAHIVFCVSVVCVSSSCV